MRSSTKQTYEYEKGFRDGFKEGYNRAFEDMMIKKQYKLSTKAVVFVKNESK